jgi:hypothetical protein
MVLLHIAKTLLGRFPPVLQFRLPYCSEKYQFADHVIREWGLECYHQEPVSIHCRWKNDILGLLYGFSNSRGIIQMPMDTHPSDNPICVHDVLKGPRAHMDWPWDLFLIGHKSTDSDLADGDLPLHCDRLPGGAISPDFIFPLREWTDDDIWDYIEEHNLPVDSARYDQKNRREWEDRRMNSDYFPICMACVQPGGGSVQCPKYKCEVANVTERVPFADINPTYFGIRK